ncbi:MAG: prolyl oligopeptidase family serine peptidase [Acidobacteriota bacterium]
MRRNPVALILALIVLVPVTFAAGHKYPQTATGDVAEDYHGTIVKDPYRWLEDDVRTSDNVADWVKAQNEITFGYLEGLEQREPIRDRLTELWNYQKYSSPFKNSGNYFYFKNDGLQNQSVLYTVGDNLAGEPKVVLDVNAWSEDGTVALAGLSFSDDGRYMAYAKAESGSDWSKWYVRDLRTGKDLADVLNWTKFTGASWTQDSRGFFYSRFDAMAEEDKFQGLNKNQKVYYHRVGTNQSEDVLVYKRPDEPEWGFSANVTEDGRYLILSVWKGTDPRNRVLYKDLLEPYGMPVDLIDNFDYGYSLIGNDGPLFYFETDYEAPNGRVIAIDIRNPEKENWREVIAESDLPLRNVGLTGNMFVASYLRDAVSYVRMFRTDGTHVRDVEFPGIGGGGGFGGKRSEVETFYTYSSFNRPPTIYRYDMLTGESELWRQAKVAFDPEAYEVKQIFYTSKDGTRVPMFIAHKKGLELDGRRPTLLYGYGGFNISLTPRFSVTRLSWMEMGGVFAMANLRGGGEYGKKWHDQGKKTHKQNVFDDFISAAEWLIANDYTNPDKLAVQGGSNGGLLVGAVMTQRPELFAAALPAVGVMDMLRFHKFTSGRYWVDDYGSADDAEEFKVLYAYSPYHNIKPGTRYPATLVTTADTDDRVVPGHSFKFAAALQKAHKGDEPVMIRIETRAGHGGGKPTALRIEEAADQWAFLAENLAMELPPPYDDKQKN